jgi:hypothetical protein
MPKYDFCCPKCSNLKGIDKSVIEDLDIRIRNKELFFTIDCKMADKPEHPKCPKCGKKSSRNFDEQNNESWIRGCGLVNDRPGARRDMNKHHLVNDDPYAQYRQSGEVDHLVDKCDRAGKRMDIINARSAATSRKYAAKARRMKYDLSDDQIKLMNIIKGNDKCVYSDFSEIEDVNKVISSLMYDHICMNGDFYRLMAAGKKALEEINADF